MRKTILVVLLMLAPAFAESSGCRAVVGPSVSSTHTAYPKLQPANLNPDPVEYWAGLLKLLSANEVASEEQLKYFLPGLQIAQTHLNGLPSPVQADLMPFSSVHAVTNSTGDVLSPDYHLEYAAKMRGIDNVALYLLIIYQRGMDYTDGQAYRYIYRLYGAGGSFISSAESSDWIFGIDPALRQPL